MVSETNAFRKYILLRSMVVVYIAAALVVIALIWLVLVVTAGSTHIYRFGLLLQLIGVLALAPDILGKERFARRGADLQTPPVPSTGEAAGEAAAGGPAAGGPAAGAEPGGEPADAQGTAAPQPAGAPAGTPLVTPVVIPMRGPAAPAAVPGAPVGYAADDRFDFYQSHNRLIILGNGLAALCLIGWLAASIVDPRSLRFPEEIFLRELLSLVGFAWINGYLLIHIYRAIQSSIPPAILGMFFSIDMGLSVMGVVFAGGIYVLSGWLRRGMHYVYGSGARRVLRWVTLPLFALSLLLELLATFW